MTATTSTIDGARLARVLDRWREQFARVQHLVARARVLRDAEAVRLADKECRVYLSLTSHLREACPTDPRFRSELSRSFAAMVADDDQLVALHRRAVRNDPLTRREPPDISALIA